MDVCIVPIIALVLASLGRAEAFGSRIVGGTDAVNGQYPYQASLGGDVTRHLCGGVILNRYHVISAAHCLKGLPRVVRVGSVSLTKGDIQVHNISRSMHHPKFNPRTLQNDLLVLKLKTPIRYSRFVQPIPLGSVHIGEKVAVVVSGWGMLNTTTSTPNILHHIKLVTVNNTYCHNVNPGTKYEQVTDDMLCTLTKRGEGVCYGDSGSPLVANGTLLGIVSWGIRPCATGAPDVFTRISSYVDWISNVTSSKPRL